MTSSCRQRCSAVSRVYARIVLCAVLIGSPWLRAEEISYTRDVRPVLSGNCFQCHGPDENHREAGLRLDQPPSIALSELVGRISSHDPDVRMPPPSSGKTLEDGEVSLLKRWVASGAPYERHWSYVPPTRPLLPETEKSVEHPIDCFVQDRLDREGLEPSPPADRLTLVRRVYLDLIGLPPTPEEAGAFLQDTSEHAYEDLVDRLLDSPHYGERWARRWLDMARYADTNGYEKDRERSIWPYRDWVIRALNADMGYDQFAIEQLAGDMLPDATPAQRIATGFHRNTMLNEEGGIDPLEFRFHATVDRIATTGTVFLGMTVGCAQCHTHKFDPITHTDYFRMMAFLNNADEPDYFVPDKEKEQAHRESVERAQTKVAGLAEKWPEEALPLEQAFEAWLGRERAKAAVWSTRVPTDATSNLPLLALEQGGVVFASGDTTKHDIYRLRYRAQSAETAALRIEALPDDRLPARGPGMTYYEGTKGDFFLSELRVLTDDGAVLVAGATQSYAKNRFGDQPAGAALAVDGDLQTGWSVHGRIGERHVAVFVLREPIPAGVPFELEMHFGRHFGSSLGKFRVSSTAEPKDGSALALGAEIEHLLTLDSDELVAKDRGRLRESFLLSAPELKAETDRVVELRRARGRTTTLVLSERPAEHPRATHRHHRGEFLQPKERVFPGVPDFLHDWPIGVPRDRLGFARWLVAPENPLAARVVVNRHWSAFFGRGLVVTPGDFGAQGATPSHPELLDWLAVEFMEGGWSLKALHRQIVTSATYQQSSDVTAALVARDPDNRLLARGSRFRLEAEVLRDAALRSAGVLSDKMFGPPVRPPQPEGITEVAFGRPKWQASEGEGRTRRSLYTYMKRTAPYALFQTFDAPSGEACVVRRDVSNTALQALSLLNDPQMIEIAQAMGASLSKHERSRAALGDTVEYAFRRVLTRYPTSDEVLSLESFVVSQRERFSSDLDVAREVAGDGLDHELVNRAAWVALARVLLSLDETLTHN